MKHNDIMWVVMGSTPQQHDEDEYSEGTIVWVACVTNNEEKANTFANSLNLKAKEVVQKVTIEYNKEAFIKNQFEEDEDYDGFYSQRIHSLETNNKIEEEIELCDDIIVYVGLLVMLNKSIKKSDELFKYRSKVAKEEQMIDLSQKMHGEYYEKYMLNYLYNQNY